MSGWQRIGVAISVFWVIAVSIYGMYSINVQANSHYSQCSVNAYTLYGRGSPSENPDKLKERQAECDQNFVDQFFIIAGEGWVIFWLAILAPLVLYLIVASRIFATVRWRRGFDQSRDTQTP